MMKSLAILALVSCLGLAACNSSGGLGDMSSDETLGTGAGAVSGGLIGYAVAGGPAGVLIGMAAGGLIGNRLSNALEGDAGTAAGHAAARAAESSTGQVITWRKTGAFFQTEAQGYATPEGSLFTDASGRTCRYIKETAIVKKKETTDTVRLCKESKGWVAA
jgi:osmotically inducible lipoprotein OsmB